ncbi:MAG: tRNA (adenosine(37)-N6)-threonylcarbamoyltransferase complex ATPase subunit type 1 TsaE [Eubacteriaceae bacterium]|nr:tRNA (adenosine(37)-N6)-threonylcarbamoyltransferase complex ATPase subunit type 1 TsaE [Eubacteriaceae bacterium]
MEEDRTLEFYSGSTKDTDRLGKALSLSVGKGGIILLRGDLAAGKTALSRSIFSARGYEKGFCSPTFSIVNIYEKEGSSAVHADLYRLADAEELVFTGFYDVLEDSEITVVEWPKLIEEEFAGRAVTVDIDITGEGQRVFRICAPDDETAGKIREELYADTGC